ncbi:MAG: DUF4336 domain-containing protein [Cyanobacteria bacterium P01_E01_bin.42]
MLENLDRNIWVARKPSRYLGLEVGTRMTVIRCNNNDLILISPIAKDDNLIQEIDRLGRVKWIIAPNLYHHLFLSGFQENYPDAQLLAVPGLEKKRPDLAIAKILDPNQSSVADELESIFFEGFKVLDLTGVSLLNEFAFFHHKSKSLILTDTAFAFDETFPLLTRLAARFLRSYKQLSPSLLEKIATQEKDKVKISIQKVLKWNFKRVIVAHGNIIENEAKEQLKKGYEWFLGMTL